MSVGGSGAFAGGHGNTNPQVYLSSKNDAKNAARNAGQGEPMYHPHSKDPSTPPHYHAVNRRGLKKFPNVHYNFPLKRYQPRPMRMLGPQLPNNAFGKLMTELGEDFKSGGARGFDALEEAE